MIVGLHGKRRRRRNKHDMCDAPAAVAGQITDNLGPSNRVTDEHSILYIDPVKDGRNIVGKGVGIVTAARIIGTPMTPPVERHATPTLFRK
jgi:hypothetical protein